MPTRATAVPRRARADTRAARSQLDAHAVARGDGVGPLGLRQRLDLAQHFVVVAGVVAVEDELLDVRGAGELDGLGEGAVAPALLAGAVLLGGVLGVVDQHVGVAGELDEQLVDVVRRVLGVGGEDDALAALVDAKGQPRRAGDIDFFVVRENTEGEYSSIGGRMFEGTEREIVIQETVMSRHGVDRALKFAFELAASRPRRKLTSATKSNGISITMPYWDERVQAMAKAYPQVSVDSFHIDILTAHFVQRPQHFDVVVASNLFGDILSDLGPACTGTIGIAPSANLNPTREWPSLFEPVHGSAPDIAGKGLANPIGQAWSAAMMLDFLGHRDAHDAVLAAIEALLSDAQAPRTPDIGGTATTQDLGRALAETVAGGR